MMRVLMVWLMLVGVAQAQDKPMGVFNCGPNPPAWVTLCDLKSGATDAELHHARKLSEQRGIQWWFFLDVAPANTPAGPLAVAAKARLAATGLLAYVIAVSVGEEWYERLDNGEFSRFGLTFPAGVPIVHDWLGRQHKAVFAVFGLPMVWLTTLVNNDRSLGESLWRPVPAYTHVVAVDAYVTAGETFDSSVAPRLSHAERTTDLPLVLIPQWFYMTDGGQFRKRPTVEDAMKFRQWGERPRWIATFGFTWLSSKGDKIVGLVEMPEIMAAALGVK